MIKQYLWLVDRKVLQSCRGSYELVANVCAVCLQAVMVPCIRVEPVVLLPQGPTPTVPKYRTLQTWDVYAIWIPDAMWFGSQMTGHWDGFIWIAISIHTWYD